MSKGEEIMADPQGFGKKLQKNFEGLRKSIEDPPIHQDRMST